MRLKTNSEDFRVCANCSSGTKFPTGSLRRAPTAQREALDSRGLVDVGVRDCQRRPQCTIAYAGLKDRQAVTDQYITIERRAVELNLPQPAGAAGRHHGPADHQPAEHGQRVHASWCAICVPVHRAAHLRRSVPSLIKTGLPELLRRPALRLPAPRPGVPDAQRVARRLRTRPAAVRSPSRRRWRSRATSSSSTRCSCSWGDWEDLRSHRARAPPTSRCLQHLLCGPRRLPRRARAACRCASA